MNETSDTTRNLPRSMRRRIGARALRVRSTPILIVAVVAGVLLLAAATYFGYAFWATRTPDGSGPEYLREWARVVRWSPDDVGARVELAYAYREIGENAAALEHLDYAVKREPLNTGARFNRAMVYSGGWQRREGRRGPLDRPGGRPGITPRPRSPWESTTPRSVSTARCWSLCVPCSRSNRASPACSTWPASPTRTQVTPTGPRTLQAGA